MGVIDEDAKALKQWVEDSKPQSIIVMTDGSMHSWDRPLVELEKERESWWKGYVNSSTWNKKSKTTYTATDGIETKDIDISKVSLEVVG